MLELPGAMNIHNHRGGLTRYYPEAVSLVKADVTSLVRLGSLDIRAKALSAVVDISQGYGRSLIKGLASHALACCYSLLY